MVPAAQIDLVLNAATPHITAVALEEYQDRHTGAPLEASARAAPAADSEVVAQAGAAAVMPTVTSAVIAQAAAFPRAESPVIPIARLGDINGALFPASWVPAVRCSGSGMSAPLSSESARLTVACKPLNVLKRAKRAGHDATLRRWSPSLVPHLLPCRGSARLPAYLRG